MKKRIALAAVLAAVISVPSSAFADRRIFGFTYPYMTLPRGSFEIEHYLDLGLGGWDNPATPQIERDWTHPAWQHQVELEYGITDRLDFGFYNVFVQDPFGNLRFEGTKLRSRYRFADPGVFPIDTSVYLEASYFGDEIEIEQRLILSRFFGRLEMTANFTAEQGFEIDGHEWEHLITPSLGIGLHVSPGLAVTLEYVGRMQISEENVHYTSYLGPGISVAGGPFYWTLTAQPQLGNRRSLAAVQIRSIFGIFL